MRQPRLSTSPFSFATLRLCGFLLGFIATFLFTHVYATAQEVAVLEPGQSITRELRGGTTHSYAIKLTAGQFLRAVVEQRGVNVLVTLYDPDGQKIADLDSPVGAEGAEPVSLLAETTGLYRLDVRTLQQNAPLGRYEVKVEEVRPAQPQDNERIAAARAYAEATLTYQGTAESLRKGIEKYEKIIPLWRALRDPQQEAITLTAIGLLHRSLGEYQQSLAYYQRALPLYHAANDRKGEALMHYSLGAVQGELGAYQLALGEYQQALSGYEQLGDRSMLAATLGNLGVIHSGMGDQEKALALFKRALAHKQAVGDPYSEATLLNNIGLIHSYLGERQQAMEFYQRALPLYRALDNRAGESTALNNLATLYGELGDQHKALEYLEQVRQIKRASGNRVEEAIALNNIGVAYGYLHEPQKSLEYYQQALPLSRGARSTEATTLSNIGKAHSELGQHRQAQEFYGQSLQLLREMGERRGEAITLTSLGRTHRELRELQKALDCFQQALAIRQTVRDPSGEAVTRFNLAFVLHDLRQTAEARAQSAAALDIVESLRSKVASQGWRTSYLASVQQFYELDIALLMKLHQQRPTEGFAAIALQTCERARARSLLELLTEARADIRQGVAPELLARERTLQQTLDTKAAAQRQLLNGKHTTEQAAAAAREIGTLTTEYEQVQAQIRHTSPRYAALTQPVPLKLSEIQRDVLDPDTLLLEYALGEEESWLWAVTPTSWQSFVLPKRSTIEAAARRLYESLTARNQFPPNETPVQRQRRLDRADADYPAAAAALSQMILAPVTSQLAGKRLVIVGDGVLQYVPFSVLPVVSNPLSVAKSQRSNNRRRTMDNEQPLIVNHELITLPSASVLAVIRKEKAARKAASKTLAVLADPVFQRNDPRLPAANVSRAGESEFVRLRFSRIEAEEITRLVPTQQTLKALDFAANRETAIGAELGEYRIVHFATHATINQQHPELSGIVLSQVNEQGQARDGFLRLHEIFNLRLSAELVVLSACETALGKEVRGEGLIGLTRGFMYAGAPRVAASLWRTDDRAAAELMKRFYQQMLGEGQTAAAALRAAQISLRQNKRWETPYYWAAFTLQGEWK